MRGFVKQNTRKSLDKDGKPVIVPIPKSYRIAVSLGRNHQSGKYEYLWKTVHGTKSEAEKELAKFIHEHETGKLAKPGRDTLAQYLPMWLDDYCNPSLAPRTVELYRYICRLHIIPSLGKTMLTALKPQDIQHFYNEKLNSGLSARTVEICHVVLHKSLKNAVKIGLLQQNPADSVDKPRSSRPEINPMSEFEVNKFLEAAKQGPYYSLFYCYLFTGMRRSELLAVRWSDVDLLNMTISVSRSMQYLNKTENHVTFKEPKTKNSKRLIALTPSTSLVLKEHLRSRKIFLKSINPKFDPDKDFNENELVFCDPNGKPMIPDTISHAWRKLAKRMGLTSVKLHNSRHTHATVMLRQGIHPKIVQERLGHSNISTTLDTYSHVAPGLQAAAAASFDSVLNRESKLDKELSAIIQN